MGFRDKRSLEPLVSRRRVIFARHVPCREIGLSKRGVRPTTGQTPRKRRPLCDGVAKVLNPYLVGCVCREASWEGLESRIRFAMALSWPYPSSMQSMRV